MREIAPGLVHWTAMHERIGMRVSSYFLPAAGVAIDPMAPEEGPDALAEHGEPRLCVLTNRHHLRGAPALRDAFGARIVCHEAGLHEFAGSGVEVEGFAWGDELAPGVRALELDAICEEETCLHLDVAGGALAFADGVVNGRAGVGFVPDSLLGDDPEAVKRGLRAALKRILDTESFDTLLFAHGAPVVGGGRAALAGFVDG